MGDTGANLTGATTGELVAGAFAGARVAGFSLGANVMGSLLTGDFVIRAFGAGVTGAGVGADAGAETGTFVALFPPMDVVLGALVTEVTGVFVGDRVIRAFGAGVTGAAGAAGAEAGRFVALFPTIDDILGALVTGVFVELVAFAIMDNVLGDFVT
jgi:hypothetical protein